MGMDLQTPSFGNPEMKEGKEAMAKAWKSFLHSLVPALLERARAPLPTTPGRSGEGGTGRTTPPAGVEEWGDAEGKDGFTTELWHIAAQR